MHTTLCIFIDAHNVFFLNSIVPFEFTTQPTNTTTVQNNNVVMTCEAQGTEIINITWISPNGTIITRDFSYISFQISSSLTRITFNLRFNNVQMSQSEGWYTCICYAYNGSIESTRSLIAAAYLYVQGKVL